MDYTLITVHLPRTIDLKDQDKVKSRLMTQNLYREDVERVAMSLRERRPSQEGYVSELWTTMDHSDRKPVRVIWQ